MAEDKPCHVRLSGGASANVFAADSDGRERLWHNAQDPQVVIDADGVFLSVSPASTRLIGWTPDEMVGRSLFEFIRTDDADQAASRTALQQANLGAATPQQATRGQTVLIVDDETAVRMLVGDVLSELGYNLIEAEDGPAALKLLQSGTRIDLLITDVGMPGMNGRQLADAARASWPKLKTLFITGYAEAAVISHGHLDASMAIITKPFAVDVLANRVKGMIDV